MLNLTVNGRAASVDAEPDMPLLWALRENLQLTGTKFGCGMALCGACTVHLDGKPVRSCSTPMSAAAGKKVVTIESIGASKAGKAVQAWQLPATSPSKTGIVSSAVASARETRSLRSAVIGTAAMSVAFWPLLLTSGS